MFPWKRHKVDATRALKEQAVTTRNEVSRIALLLEGSNPACCEALRVTCAELMDKVTEAQGWLRSLGAVKRTP